MELAANLKVKVVIGEGQTQTIKRLVKIPEDYEELQEMIHHRLRERLPYCDTHCKCKYYYQDMSNGMISISSWNDLKLAFEYCKMYDLKSLKIFVFDYQLERTIDRSRMDYTIVDVNNDDENESDHSEQEDSQDFKEAQREYQELEQKKKLEDYEAIDENQQNPPPAELEVVKQSQNSLMSNEKDSDNDLKLLKIGKSCISEDENSSDFSQEGEGNVEPQFLNYSNDEHDEDDVNEHVQVEKPKFNESSIRPNFEESYDMVSEPLFENSNKANNDKFDDKPSQNLEDPKLDVFGNKDDFAEPSPEKPKAEKIMVNNQEFEENAMGNANNYENQVPYNENDDYEHKQEEVENMVHKINLDHKNDLKIIGFVRKPIHSVFEPVYSLKLSKSCANELPKESGFSFFTSRIKQSIAGLTEEEADQLLRVDETHDELSNQDVILCKPKSLVKKTWRVKNLGTRQWPYDTRLVSVTDDLYFESPRITNYLKPGEMMDISTKIFIPESVNGNNNIKEYIMRLYCNEFKCFGEPIIATCHIDTNLYNESILMNDSTEQQIPRVTDSDIIENYAIAKEVSERQNEPYGKVLYDLGRADKYKF